MSVYDLSVYEKYATPRQLEYMQAVNDAGSVKKAANALGVAKSTLQEGIRSAKAKAARHASVETQFGDGLPDSYVRGKITLQRNAYGEVVQSWERASPDQEIDVQAAILEAMRDEITPIKAVEQKEYADENLLTVIPLGDPHFGMFSWAQETGENFDLKIAEEVTRQAIASIVYRSPASAVGLLLNLGDFFHADNSTNRTPRSGANLDVDGRFAKIATAGVRAMTDAVVLMLEKHDKVVVRNNIGNHDPHQAAMLSIALAARFHGNPRVDVDVSPNPFWYYEWGNTLIGSTHGDGAKLNDLPLIMANDQKQMWANTIWRIWHVGHFHHNQRMTQKDLVGCEVETHRTLAGTDAWHHHSGYRSYKDLKGIVYDREEGEIMRFRSGRS